MMPSPTRIGLGVAYYGGILPQHAESVRACLRAGIPGLEIHGCAYPEMARAEILRDAIDADVDAVVITDHDVQFSVDDVRDLCEIAIRNDAVATAFHVPGEIDYSTRRHYAVKPVGAPWSDAVQGSSCSFAAIPRSVLRALDQVEDRNFTNSIGVNTQMKTSTRPYFSPWQKAPGALETVPVAPGVYCEPDQAFMLRVAKAGAKILRCDQMVIPVTKLGLPRHRLNIRNPPGLEAKRRRRRHEIKTNYAVCVPSYGALDREQLAALWELEKAGVSIVELNGCPYIDLVRAELVAIALDQLGADGVFFLDHDIIFRPIDALKLIDEAEARQDVVAGMYNMRTTAHSLIGALDVPRDTQVPFFDIGEVLPAFYCGLGFAAVPRCVLDKLRGHYPALMGFRDQTVHPLFALDVNGNFYSGEDTSFCGRVQGLHVNIVPAERTPATPNAVDWELSRDGIPNPTGHRVWIDTRPRIFHKGSYLYGIEDHSIGVPRYAKLRAQLCVSRAEARAFLRKADELPVETKLRPLGLDEGAQSPHAGLEK